MYQKLVKDWLHQTVFNCILVENTSDIVGWRRWELGEISSSCGCDGFAQSWAEYGTVSQRILLCYWCCIWAKGPTTQQDFHRVKLILLNSTRIVQTSNKAGWISFIITIYSYLFFISSFFKIYNTKIFEHPMHFSWRYVLILCFHV